MLLTHSIIIVTATTSKITYKWNVNIKMWRDFYNTNDARKQKLRKYNSVSYFLPIRYHWHVHSLFKCDFLHLVMEKPIEQCSTYRSGKCEWKNNGLIFDISCCGWPRDDCCMIYRVLTKDATLTYYRKTVEACL